MNLLSGDGLLFLMRWGHFLAGITWIGLLYYFNFVQVPFFAEADAPVKNSAIMKLVPRALGWFRYAALVTFLTGLVILLVRGAQGGAAIWSTPWGISILTGATLGTLMFLNVWLVIWPKQKVVIASTTAVAGGGQANPAAAAAGRRAFLASRTNVLFSVPMLLFMGAASHWSFFGTTTAGAIWTYVLVGALIVAAIEANALVGSTGAAKKPLETISRVVVAGFVLAAVLYVLATAAL